MLAYINIKNLVLIEELELELKPGMTVITGETGVGKSIIIDALDIALGERAASHIVRQGEERCEITLGFYLQNNQAACGWLTEQSLDDKDECIIRRVINNQGRSRHFINGRPVALQQLKELGLLLLNIHAQHAQYALLKREEQRKVLDNYAAHSELLRTVADIHGNLQTTQTHLLSLQNRLGDREARIRLLEYQLQEFIDLGLREDELTELHQEHQQRAHVDELITACNQALDNLANQPTGNILSSLSLLQRLLQPLTAFDTKITKITELLDNALIQTQEAYQELQHYCNHIDNDPERMQWLEQRLAIIYALARKHRVGAEQINEVHKKLDQELKELISSEEKLAYLKQQENDLILAYQQAALALNKSRLKAAKELSKYVTEEIQGLGMKGGKFVIEVCMDEQYRSASGSDRIEFLVSGNPGQVLQPLAKVASGGELSRISLAIQVLTAQSTVASTLVFDEVDVGIGGRTADTVGRLLKRLGICNQILCVTHLPQVAAQGDHHLLIDKETVNDITRTQISFLTHQQRVEELARMLGSDKITAQTLAHAEEMLA